MIQRIQTVWLFLSALFAALTYKFPFYTGNVINKEKVQVYENLVASSSFLLLIFTAVLVGGAIYIIFMYKNRKQQIWLTVGALGLSIINIILYFSELKKFISGNTALTSVFVLAIPVFLLLAINGIWKDEKLVKSLDRLR
jgi:drug/metabolite transporter superfamily protein YnfA